MVLVMTSVSVLILAGTMSRTYTVAKLNDRNAQNDIGMMAADAAVEKIVYQLRNDYMNNGADTAATNKIKYGGLYSKMVPSSGTESTYWNQFQFSDGQGHVGYSYVGCDFQQRVHCSSGSAAGRICTVYSG